MSARELMRLLPNDAKVPTYAAAGILFLDQAAVLPTQALLERKRRIALPNEEIDRLIWKC
jgi:hypothetical protein